MSALIAHRPENIQIGKERQKRHGNLSQILKRRESCVNLCYVSPDDIDKRLFALETDCGCAALTQLTLPRPRPGQHTGPPIRCAESGAGPDIGHVVTVIIRYHYYIQTGRSHNTHGDAL